MPAQQSKRWQDMRSVVLCARDEDWDRLPPRDQKILCLRYGVLDGEPKTYEDIGLRCLLPRISRERVRQLEARAVRRLLDYRKEKSD